MGCSTLSVAFGATHAPHPGIPCAASPVRVPRGPNTEPRLEPVRFEFTHPTAKAVCVAGTFNGCQAEGKLMHSEGGGLWVKEMALPVGACEYCLVVDGRRSLLGRFLGRDPMPACPRARGSTPCRALAITLARISNRVSVGDRVDVRARQGPGGAGVKTLYRLSRFRAMLPVSKCDTAERLQNTNHRG